MSSNPPTQDESMSCIYCGKEWTWKSGQGDHIIPLAFGKFYQPLKFWNICHQCNNAIGTWEAVLTGCTPEATFLCIIDPPTSGGRRIHRGTIHGVPRPRVGRKHQDHLEGVRHISKMDVLLYNQLVFKGTDGEFYWIEIPDIFTKEGLLRKFNDQPAVLERTHFWLHCEEKRLDQILTVLKEVFPNLKYEDRGTDDPHVKTQVTCVNEYELSEHTYRCIAKIGFHYFLSEFADLFTGKEDRFLSIRNYVKNGGDHSPFFRNSILLRRDPPSRVWRHDLLASYDRNRCYAVVSLFDGPMWLAPRYRINLTPGWPELEMEKKATSHGYVYQCTDEERKLGKVILTHKSRAYLAMPTL